MAQVSICLHGIIDRVVADDEEEAKKSKEQEIDALKKEPRPPLPGASAVVVHSCPGCVARRREGLVVCLTVGAVNKLKTVADRKRELEAHGVLGDFTATKQKAELKNLAKNGALFLTAPTPPPVEPERTVSDTPIPRPVTPPYTSRPLIAIVMLSTMLSDPPPPLSIPPPFAKLHPRWEPPRRP